MNESFRPWLTWDSDRYNRLSDPPNVPLGNIINREERASATPTRRDDSKQAEEARQSRNTVLTSTRPRLTSIRPDLYD